MKSQFTILAALALLAGGCVHAYPPRSLLPNPGAAPEEATARGLIEKLAQHDYVAAYANFDDSLKARVAPEKLSKFWTDLEELWGPLVRIEEVRAQSYGKRWAALVVCQFSSDIQTFSIYFDQEAKIRGYASNPSAAGGMFIDALGHGHPEWADSFSDGRMHDEGPPEKLGELWAAIESKFGHYQHVAEVINRGLYARVIVSFSHTFATFHVAINPRGQVDLIKVSAVGEPPPPKPRPEVKPEPHGDDSKADLKSAPDTSSPSDE